MDVLKDYYKKKFEFFLVCYKLSRESHRGVIFQNLSDAIMYANYLKDKNSIYLIERAVLDEDIVKSECVTDEETSRIFRKAFQISDKCHVDVRELLYTILYLDDCDVNKLWNKFIEITPDRINFYNSDIFSRNTNDDYSIVGKSNIIQFPSVSAALLNSKINMITDEELRNKVMKRFSSDMLNMDKKKIRKLG